MSDLIDRQAAIDAVKKNTFRLTFAEEQNCEGHVAWSAYAVYSDAIEGKLLELPSAHPEQRWIPCSERLPEVHESGNSFSGVYMQSDPVLVYGVCEYEENARFHIVTYCDDLDGNTYWSTELDALTITQVVAWMPLPEPPKGGETNE